MKLEDQVCSLELSKRLKELGVKQESLFYWEMHYAVPSVIYMPSRDTNDAHISAFTVAELGVMLPPDTPSDRSQSGNCCCWMAMSEDGDETHWDEVATFGGAHDGLTPYIVRKEPTEADARAKMLIYLIEQQMVKP